MANDLNIARAAVEAANRSKDASEAKYREAYDRLNAETAETNRLAADLGRIRKERDTLKVKLAEKTKELEASLKRKNEPAASHTQPDRPPAASSVTSAASIAHVASGSADRLTREKMARHEASSNAALAASFPDAVKAGIETIKRIPSTRKSPFNYSARARKLRIFAAELSEEIDLSGHILVEIASLKCGGMAQLMNLLASGAYDDEICDLANIDSTLCTH
jgi:hypothetical protein